MGNCQNFSNDDSKSTIEQPKQKAQLLIKSSTWQRESHGLFDYESKTIIQKNFRTTIPGRIVRTGESILWKKENYMSRAPKKQEGSLGSNETELIRLMSKEDVFWVLPSTDPNKQRDPREPPEDGLWLVVKSYKQANPDSKGYKLSEGEYLKLGRVRYRIKELKNQASPKKDASKEKNEEAGSIILDDQKQPSLNNSMTNISQKVNPIACKICLSEVVDSSVGPLISPCLCAGTMKHVHLKCLQKWLQSRLHVKNNGNATSYHWKPFECELCKHPYPAQLEIDKKKCDLVEIPKPETPYILLELLGKDSNQPRGAHLISMESKSSVRMGRGHDSDIRVTDISVSRCHAMIRMEKGNFYIEDNNSKFGTLVYATKPIAIMNEFSNISVQVGRTVLNLSLQKYAKRTASCFTSSKIPTDADEISEGELQDGFDDGNDSQDEQPMPQNQDEIQMNMAPEDNDVGVSEDENIEPEALGDNNNQNNQQ